MSRKCCCCHLWTDAFDRAAIGDDWTEAAGTWAIASGALTTSSTSAVILSDRTHGPPFVILVKLAWGSGGIVRIIWNYTDTDNYDFFQYNGTTAKLYTRRGGTDTERATNTVSIASGSTVLVCVTPSAAVVKHPTLSTTYVLMPYGTTEGKWGFGTGSNATGVAFDDVSLEVHKEERKSCKGCVTCPDCTGGSVAAEYEAEIAGVVVPANGIEVNGKFVMAWSPCGLGGSYYSQCNWWYGDNTEILTPPLYDILSVSGTYFVIDGLHAAEFNAKIYTNHQAGDGTNSPYVRMAVAYESGGQTYVSKTGAPADTGKISAGMRQGIFYVRMFLAAGMGGMFLDGVIGFLRCNPPGFVALCDQSGLDYSKCANDVEYATFGELLDDDCEFDEREITKLTGGGPGAYYEYDFSAATMTIRRL